LEAGVGRDDLDLPAASNTNPIGKSQMYNIIYLVGLIVVVLAILSFVGLA
jgi:hypothetical protein